MDGYLSTRTVDDVEAWRAHIEIKRAESARWRALELAARTARPVRVKAPPRTPKQNPARQPREVIDPAPSVELYVGGMSITEVAERRGVSALTVRKHLRRAHVPLRPRERPVARPRGQRNRDVIDPAPSVELYVGGLSVSEVAERRGINPATVRRHLMEAGVALRPREARPVIDPAPSVELYTGGMSIMEVAERRGLSAPTVRKHLVDAGVPLRARPPVVRKVREQRPRKVIDPAPSIELYLAGRSIVQVAAERGISPVTVSGHLRAAGITIRERTRTLDVDAVVSLYTGGRGYKDVAAILGVAPSTVLIALHDAGVTMRGRGHRITPPTGSKPKEYDPQLIAQVRQLAAADMTQGEIAAETGTTRKIIWRVMGRYGIEARLAKAKVGADHAAGLKALMAERQVTSAQVRQWARSQGRVCSDRGLPSAPLLREYLAA